MGTLTCVRHGQASFGAANYDQLSPLGAAQAHALGGYWAQRGMRFDAVYAGTLQRHAQTAASLSRGLFLVPNSLGVPEPITSDAMVFDSTSGLVVQRNAALNEYDSEALMAAQLLAAPPSQALPSPHTPEGYKAHFRLLRQALQAWITGDLNPSGMPSFANFRAGLAALADDIAKEPKRQVLVVSSGGPLSTLVMHVLQANPLAMIELNFQMKNTAVTQFHLSHQRLHLSGFNALPHLDKPELRDWVTST